MPRKSTNTTRSTGHNRRLKWGDGWIEERSNASGEARYLACWSEKEPDGQRRKHAKMFKSGDAAEAFLRDQADRRAKADYVSPERMTVADLIEGYIVRGAYAWKPATVAAYRSRASSLLLPVLGALPVSQATPPRIQHWVDGLVRRSVSAQTIDGVIRVLQGAFRDAVRLGIVPSNPVTGVKRPAVRLKQVAVWNADEVRRVLAVVADDPMWIAAYRLALGAGPRPGELRVVRWSDLDLTAGTLTIRRSMTKDAEGRPVVGTTTKTGRPRAVALSSSVVAALRDWRKCQLAQRVAAPVWSDADLVFATDRGELPSETLWRDQLARVIAAADVRVITLHGLRHTAATLMLEQGIPAKVVSDILGHQNIGTTVNLYQHVSPELQRIAAETMDRHLFGVVVLSHDAQHG